MYTRLRTFALSFSAIFLLLGCQLPALNVGSQTPVSLQLKWLHQAQFAGFYYADQAGFFAEEGLDVTFLEGGPSINGVERVLSGEADFGVTGAEQILLERSLGKPLVAIATTYRLNPWVLVSLAESGIDRPEDLLGKSVAIGGNIGAVQVRAMMSFLGLNYDELNIVPYSLDLAPFYAGEVDVVPAFSAGSLVPILHTGHKLNLIWPNDYGIHFYSDTIFTTEKMIAEKPELVTAFLRAALRGHRMAVENADQATEHSMQYLKDADPAIQSEMILASMPLINTGEDHIGWMQREVWAGMYATLREQGFLEADVDVDAVYTNGFLETIYAGQ